MLRLFFLLLVLFSPLSALQIKDALASAKEGDWLVVSRNKNHTMLVVTGKANGKLTLEEITVPEGRLPGSFNGWRGWAESGAPCHTCWVRYEVDTQGGALRNMYSLSQGSWIEVSPSENIFSTLINLQFSAVPDSKRKQIMTRSGETRPWQPKLVLNGAEVAGAEFTVWGTTWPRDQSELSGKEVQIFLPANAPEAPSYFPYWLKIKGGVAKATLRVVDSGRNLQLSTAQR